MPSPAAEVTVCLKRNSSKNPMNFQWFAQTNQAKHFGITQKFAINTSISHVNIVISYYFYNYSGQRTIAKVMCQMKFLVFYSFVQILPRFCTFMFLNGSSR